MEVIEEHFGVLFILVSFVVSDFFSEVDGWVGPSLVQVVHKRNILVSFMSTGDFFFQMPFAELKSEFRFILRFALVLRSLRWRVQ